MPTTTYAIRPRLAVRAFALAAALAVAGALLTVLASEYRWPGAALALGVLLMAAAVALVGAALYARAKGRVLVELDEGGYRITGAAVNHEGSWSQISKVTRAAGRLTFHGGDTGGFALVDPSGDEAQLERLASDVSARLDRDRGYGLT